MKDKNKRRILITGAGSGLGKETAIELAKREHIVYAACLYKEETEMYNSLTDEFSNRIHSFQMDIRNKDDRNKAIQYPVNTLICNSAIGDSGSVSEVKIDRFREVFEINVFSNFELIQLFIKKMLNENIDSKLIILSSLVGRIPLPFLSPYCSSKACIDSMTTCLRTELKYLQKDKKKNDNKLQVCCIEPGAYATGFNNINRNKKYTWMNKESYFKYKLDEINKYDDVFWQLSEKKNFDSIINKYIKAVETKTLKHRYHAPISQVFLVQLGRIFGL